MWSLVKHHDGKTCKTTKDGSNSEFESHYIKEFQWTNIDLDPMNSLITNSGMAASENEKKRVLVYLGAARRILNIETLPSSCTVEKCKFTDNKLTNSNVKSPESFSTANLESNPKHVSGFRFTCGSEITKIRIEFTDLDTSLPVYPRMSIPVTNAVKVWDSYCKTAVNKGHASRAYLVGNERPEGNDSKHHRRHTRDYMGIRSDEIGGFERYSNNADDPAYIAVFFGFRIRVCNFFVSMPRKAPKDLVLFMDGNEIAKVTADAPDKVSDLLDWYNGTTNPNDLVGSSFKIVWPAEKDSNGEWTIAHLTRITISYTEPGHPIRHWKSTLGHPSDNLIYEEDYEWRLHQTEHPRVKSLRLDWDHLSAKAYSRDTLCRPGQRWYPETGALIGYKAWQTDEDTKIAQKAGALHLVCRSEINLTAFIINFPDFGEKIDDNDTTTKYHARSRSSGIKLIAQSGEFQNSRVIAEFDKGQIAANRLNLLDYRTTNYLAKIKTLTLIFDKKDKDDNRENVINSIDMFYFINEFTPQKVWESTHRLKSSPVALPSYIGVKDEAMFTVQDFSRTIGHTKQMMTEGFPNYWKAGDVSDRQIDIEFNGIIVMTSFIFETCRIYRENNYRNVKLECFIENAYQVICETPEKVGYRAKKHENDSVDPDTTTKWSSTEEPWSPGDHIEMFDHKKKKHMPYITGKKFRLSFPNTGSVAVGKLSVGYYDVNDESRDSKWVPGDFDCANIIHPDFKTTSMQQLNSNPFTAWWSTSTDYLEIKFNEKVRIKNVILGLDIQHDSDSSKYYRVAELDDYGRSQPNKSGNYMHQNLKLFIDDTKVANTDESFSLEANQTHIHFFEYTANENWNQDSSVYRHDVHCCETSIDGKNVKLQWKDKNCKAATLEIIYSKIVPSDLELAERACLAAHNNYRFRHGLSVDYNYILDYTNGTADALIQSARDYAEDLIKNKKWEHSPEAIRGDYGENLFRIRWPSKPSEFDILAVAGEAVKQWYSEYVNFNKDTSNHNGNILHNGQIGHFLQVICKGTENNGKIGVGIKSSKDSLTTVVCVHYEKRAKGMDKTKSYISYPKYIGATSLLTIQEEQELRKVIASGKAKDLYKTCKFYLSKSKDKLKFMEDEATAEFAKIIETGYDAENWKKEIKKIKALVTSAEGRTSVSNLTSDISAIRIPNSLAETSFKNLQLTGFFLKTIDVLGLHILVNGCTPDSAIIQNQPLQAIIDCSENGWVNQNDYADNLIQWTTDAAKGYVSNGCPEDERPACRSCIRVMLGLFGVRTGQSRHYDEKDAAFTEAWQKIIRRLKWVFNGELVPTAVIIEYNRFKGLGKELTYLIGKELKDAKEYAKTCPKEAHTTQDLAIQYDHIENTDD